MRKLVVENKVTLDGVFNKQAEWQMQFWEGPDELVRYSKDHLTAFDAPLERVWEAWTDPDQVDQ
ncbi:SRPBCC domain-containing protein [Haladaptatus pallidirubidus]|uniref:Uncharacterized protein n=1 Tax=Haladaptatus pallidirubidus TaxID=1008152 RepID=A0AAV3UHF7_9EURY|nr:hypothetical protein [Haladaptatus pallidirubidus]